MKIEIEVPLETDIVGRGFQVTVDSGDRGWSKSQLGDYADRRGVYIHHADATILYVGKATKGDWGHFGERLRREFQKTSSGNSSLFQLLASQTRPIRAYLLDLDEIDKMIGPSSLALSRERKALAMEQLLIGLYDPPGNIL